MMISVDDAARIMAAVQLGQKLPIESIEASRMAEGFRNEIQKFPAGVVVSIPADWDVDDRRALVAESVRRTLTETLVRSDRFRLYEASVSGPSITAGGGDHWKGQPRAKDGKWIDSGVDYSKWGKHAYYEIKKIKLFEKLVADGDFETFSKLAPQFKAKELNSYQKGILKAYANLSEIVKQTQQAAPKNAVEVPGTPALAGWSKIGGSLGTEKGGTYIGPDGKKYYVKTPDNAARAHNEVLAFKLYELAGGKVVHAQLVQVEGKIGIATEWEEAEKLKWSAGDKVAAADDFALHAWLNNWDAVGAGSENPMDNIKLIKGNATLVDAGGSLDYSGMGGSGKKPFTEFAKEWTTLRDPKINKTMAQVFGGMTDKQLHASAMKLSNVSYNDISELVDKYHPGNDAEKQAMIETLEKRKTSIVGQGLALLQKNPSLSDPVTDQAAPVVVHAQPGTGKPEQIPPPKPAVVAASKPVVVPPKPWSLGYSATAPVQAKASQIAILAKSGDLSAIKAIKTNPNAQQKNLKKLHEYKMSVIAALEAGAKTNPEHVEPPEVNSSGATFAEYKAKQATAEAAAVAAESGVQAASDAVSGKASKGTPAALFSPAPAFAGSKAGINEKHALDMIKFARVGDKAGVASIVVPEGTKIAAYQKKLMAEIDQIPAKKEAFKKQKLQAEKAAADAKAELEKLTAEFKEKYGDLTAAAKKLVKSNTVIRQVGHWNVTHEKIPIPHIDNGQFLETGTDAQVALMTAGKASWSKGTASEKSALQKFTGSYSTSINDSLLAGKPSQMAKDAASAMKKHSIPLPVGLKIRRDYPFHGAGEVVVGDVIHSKALQSCTTRKEGVFSGNKVIIITMGEGVRGMPAKQFSNHSPEQEVIMMPGQRYAVTKVEEKSGKTFIHALALPSDGV